MTPNKVGETAQKFYISNLSPNITKTAITRIFSWLGPVFSVKLLTNAVLHPSGGYAIVEMLRKTNIKLTLTQLRNTKIGGYKVFITTDKIYTETRNDIAELFPGPVEENLRAADEILSDIRQKLPKSTNILQGGIFKKKA